MKEKFFREILWFFIALLLSVPLGFLYLSFATLTSSGPEANQVEKVFAVQLYVIACLVGFISVYVVRVVVMAVKMLFVPSEL
jgi:hypothetical protein